MNNPAKVAAGRYDAALRSLDEQQLAALIDEYTAYCAANNLDYHGRLLNRIPRPRVIDRDCVAELAAAAGTISGIAARVVATLRSGDRATRARLAAACGIGSFETELLSFWPELPHSFDGRFDTVLMPGGIKFIEYNPEAVIGVGFADRIARALQDMFPAVFAGAGLSYQPVTPGYFEALAGYYRQAGKEQAPERVAIMDWQGVSGYPEMLILQQEFAARGMEAVICQPQQLQERADGLYYQDLKIDLVIKRALSIELLARRQDCGGLLQAWKDGKVVMAGGMASAAVFGKGLFAAFCDPAIRTLFTAQEIAALDKYIPDTWLMDDGTALFDGSMCNKAEYALANRELCVLKPLSGNGGKGVLVGRHTPAAVWAETVQASLAGGYVLQKNIGDFPRSEYPVINGKTLEWRPMYADTCPFVFGAAAYGGLMSRLTEGAVTNLGEGGNCVPCFIAGDN